MSIKSKELLQDLYHSIFKIYKDDIGLVILQLNTDQCYYKDDYIIIDVTYNDIPKLRTVIISRQETIYYQNSQFKIITDFEDWYITKNYILNIIKENYKFMINYNKTLELGSDKDFKNKYKNILRNKKLNKIND